MAETTAAPAKAKKTAAKKPASHPKYAEMIKAAIVNGNSRVGASRQSIQKYVLKNYKVGDNVSMQIKLALKRMVDAGVVRHTKGTGASGSFKLVKPDDVKKETKAKAASPRKPPVKVIRPKVVKATKKTKPPPTKAKKAKSPAKKAKRSPVKKATPVKAKKPTPKKAKPAKPKAKPAKRAAKAKAKTAKKATKKK
ncbi:histone H1.0 [Diretmus argenteus]